MTDNNPARDPDDLDDDFELELEPVDPEILKHERRRAIEKTRRAEDSVQIDDLYEESNSDEPSDPINFGEFKKFQFSISHLLIVTALLSLVMTVFTLTTGCAPIIITFAAAVATGWWIVIRSERRQRAQKEKELAELKAKIAAQRAAQDGIDVQEVADVSKPASVEIEINKPYTEPKLDFSFSLKEMFGAFTAAALIMGFVQALGDPDNAAMLLGLIALSGLVLHTVGFDPPRVVILSWWLLLVLYLMVSLWAAFGDQASVPRAVEDDQVVAI